MDKIYGSSDYDYQRLHETILEDLSFRKIQSTNYEKYFKGHGDIRREVLTVLCFGLSEGHDETKIVNGHLYHFTEDQYPLVRIDIWGISAEKSNIEIILSDPTSETAKIIDAIKTFKYIDFENEVKSKPFGWNKDLEKYKTSRQMKGYFFEAMNYRGEIPISRNLVQKFLFSTSPKNIDKWSCNDGSFIRYCSMKRKDKTKPFKENAVMMEDIAGFTLSRLWQYYKENT